MKRISVASRLNRREVLGFLGGAAAVSLAGCFRGQAASGKPTNTSTGTSTTPSQTTTPTAIASSVPSACVVKPQQTEGPYFVDERLDRSDIRSNPADGSVRAGVPLQLALRVSQVSGDRCTPLAGAVVDIWHCDALGVYSNVNDRGFSTAGQQFLRGYQVTDAHGSVQFLTIYPGWYPGRTTHIHFKIRANSASEQNYEFTSQLYFDDATTDRVHAQAPYASKGERTVRNDDDGIFQRGGNQLLLSPIETSQGYTATFDIGLEMA